MKTGILVQTITKISLRIKSAIAPELRHAQSIYEDVLMGLSKGRDAWLDIGCGHNLLPEWRLQAEKDLVENCDLIAGIDANFSSLKKHRTISKKIMGDASSLPFKAETFDLLTANMVVEHLDNPSLQMRQIARVLRPGGLFVFHTPNLFGYATILARLIPEFLKFRIIYLLERRREDDIFKTFYKLNSRAGIIRLAGENSFRVKEIKMITSLASSAIIPPFYFFELMWIKILATKLFRPLRTNIIAILQKQD